MDSKSELRNEIEKLLAAALKILRENPKGDRDDSVCWRVADAGLLMRRLMESNDGWLNAVGLHEPTMRGASLPVGGHVGPMFVFFDDKEHTHVVYGDAYTRETLKEIFESSPVMDGGRMDLQ